MATTTTEPKINLSGATAAGPATGSLASLVGVSTPALATYGGKPVSVPTSLLASCSPYNDPCHCFVLQKFADTIQAVMLDYSRKMASPEGIFI